MCCLKYENDIYQEMRKGLPDVNEKVKTEDGMGKVIETDILQGKVKVRIYSGEKDDNGDEKLGAEIFTYSKEDVTRFEKGGKNKGKGNDNGSAS